MDTRPTKCSPVPAAISRRRGPPLLLLLLCLGLPCAARGGAQASSQAEQQGALPPGSGIPEHIHFVVTAPLSEIMYTEPAISTLTANFARLAAALGTPGPGLRRPSGGGGVPVPVPYTVHTDRPAADPGDPGGTPGDCAPLLVDLGYPGLAVAMATEPMGVYKSDICRVAVLYRHGGYYFDDDVMVRQNVMAMAALRNASFVAIWEQSDGGIFNAFLAATPGHPVLKATLDRMVARYDGVLLPDSINHHHVGPGTIADAVTHYMATASPADTATVWLLQETEQTAPMRAAAEQGHGQGQAGAGPPQPQTWSEYFVKNCRMVVVDVPSKAVVMGSHNFGSRSCPDLGSARGIRKAVKTELAGRPRLYNGAFVAVLLAIGLRCRGHSIVHARDALRGKR